MYHRLTRTPTQLSYTCLTYGDAHYRCLQLAQADTGLLNNQTNDAAHGPTRTTLRIFSSGMSLYSFIMYSSAFMSGSSSSVCK